MLSCESTSVAENNKNSVNQEVKIAKDISVKEYKELINSDAIILDVRRPIEFNAGHLKNAININYFDDDFIDQVMKLDNTKTLLIHCASGGRSAGAMAKLKNRGFSKMYNMLGGFTAWERAGYEVIK